MAKVKLMGYQEFIVITNEEAKNLQALLEDRTYSQDAMINLGKHSFKKRSVMAVSLEPVARVDENQNVVAREFYAKRDAFLKLPVKEKAKKEFGRFEIFYSGATGKHKDEISVTLEEKILAINEAYYEANPDAMCVNPALWTKEILFVENENKYRGKEMRKMDFRGFALRLIENGFISDQEDIRKKKDFETKRAIHTYNEHQKNDVELSEGGLEKSIYDLL